MAQKVIKTLTVVVGVVVGLGVEVIDPSPVVWITRAVERIH